MEKKLKRREFLKWTAAAAAGAILTACTQAPTAQPTATNSPATATNPPAMATNPPPTATNPPATATNPAPTATPAPVTLSIWHNYGPDDAKGAPLQSIFKDFMTAYPYITVKDEVYVDADIPLKVETASAAKQEPDLVFVQRVGDPLDWTTSGLTLPVNDWIKQWGMDGKFTDVALANYTLDNGQIQAFPLEGYTWPIWWNTKVLTASGVATIPTTTDELLAAIPKIKAAGYTPAIASGSDGMGEYLWTLAVQSEMTDADAKKAFADGDWTVPSAIKGVQLFSQLRDAGLFMDHVEGIDYATANTDMIGGKIAMSHFGAWEFGDPAAASLLPDIQLGGFPLPADSPHKLPIIYSAFTAKGIWVTPNGAATGMIDAVQKFIQFFYQPQMIERFVEAAGMTPPLKDVPVDKTKVNPLFLQSLSFNVEVAETPDFFLSSKIQPVLGTISQEAFTMGNTPDKILSDLTALYAANA